MQGDRSITAWRLLAEKCLVFLEHELPHAPQPMTPRIVSQQSANIISERYFWKVGAVGGYGRLEWMNGIFVHFTSRQHRTVFLSV